MSMGGNLRNMVKSFGFPDSLHDIAQHAEQCFDSDVRGTLLSDMVWFKEFDDIEEESTSQTSQADKSSSNESIFRPDTYGALQQYHRDKGISPLLKPRATHLQHIEQNHVRYVADRPAHEQRGIALHDLINSVEAMMNKGKISMIRNSPKGSSQVMICSPEESSVPPKPAVIRDIFYVNLPTENSELLLAVQFQNPTPKGPDPYATFPVLQASLWSTELSDIKLIPSTHIRCAYASCPINQEECVVVSLDRNGIHLPALN
ncbi:hypothetical protein K439DRAFT_1659913 [Ramaria rubella]|nr:hypothetical protein K439DRAFT_1659913 [Ramaria rubella]